MFEWGAYSERKRRIESVGIRRALKKSNLWSNCPKKWLRILLLDQARFPLLIEILPQVGHTKGLVIIGRLKENVFEQRRTHHYGVDERSAVHKEKVAPWIGLDKPEEVLFGWLSSHKKEPILPFKSPVEEAVKLTTIWRLRDQLEIAFRLVKRRYRLRALHFRRGIN